MQCSTKCIIAVFLTVYTFQVTAQLVPFASNILHSVKEFGQEQSTRLVKATSTAVKDVMELAVDERLKEDFFTIYKNAAIGTRELEQKPVTEDKLTFYLYTRANPKEYTAIDTDNLERFRNSTNQIVFLIHGWTNSRETPWMEDMKDAFLIRDKDAFVIIVDWKEPANDFYYVSSINTYDVSKHITKVLVNLYKNYGVDKKYFLLVGHSLGGQITGFVGKLFQKQTLEKLPRIIALDPAEKRLNKDDAEIVEVIHSDGGTFGFQDSCGTIDFFANGGSSQPGCKQIDLANLRESWDEPITCDHHRAYLYFIEAVLNPTAFESRKCDTWAKYKINYCDEVVVSMGNLTTTVKGNYYLDTNKEPPYSKKNSKWSLSSLIPH